MSYKCDILCDSLSPDGVRLTTLQVTFPRFILAEVNTHRMLSRNSASSRAIPPEKLIKRVMDEPFIPETFNTRVTGMGVGVPLVGEDASQAEETWLDARDNAVGAAEALVRLDCDKSRINRLLEPFMWHTAILSATEWENFFALRCHPDAQPEFQIIAKMMKKKIEDDEPLTVREEEWHLPLVSDFPYDTIPDWEWWAMVSAGRCARVSFDTQDQYEDPQKSYDRAARLVTSGHLSPFEHVARPLEDRDYDENYHNKIFHIDGPKYLSKIGNFRGWIQKRKLIPNEDNFNLVVQNQS